MLRKYKTYSLAIIKTNSIKLLTMYDAKEVLL